MPAFSTHYFFASDMMPYLKKNMRFNLNEDAVYMGTQGPDIFFSHRAIPLFWRGKTLRKAGSVLHRSKCGELLDEMAEYCEEKSEKPDIAKSYLCGFILHYALDRCAHPYIYEKQNEVIEERHYKNAPSAHNIVELSIDSVMVEERLGIQKPLSAKTAFMFKFNDEELCEAAKTAAMMSASVNSPKFTAEDVETAFRDVARIQGVLSDKTGLKKILAVVLENLASPFTGSFKISSMFRTNRLDYAKRFLNLEKNAWCSPYDEAKEQRNESFYDLYNMAKEDAENMLKAWQDGKTGYEITNNISFLTGLEVVE